MAQTAPPLSGSLKTIWTEMFYTGKKPFGSYSGHPVAPPATHGVQLELYRMIVGVSFLNSACFQNFSKTAQRS